MRLKEFATPGATTAGNIASLPNPHIANPDRNKNPTQALLVNLAQKVLNIINQKNKNHQTML